MTEHLLSKVQMCDLETICSVPDLPLDMMNYHIIFSASGWFYAWTQGSVWDLGDYNPIIEVDVSGRWSHGRLSISSTAAAGQPEE